MSKGPKSKYSKKFPALAYEFCAENGFTNEKLAKAFGVHRDTLHEWTKKYPDLKESIQRGKDDFDSNNVEKSLVQRACGYEYTETTCKSIQVLDEETQSFVTLLDPNTGEPKLVPTKIVHKSMAPDITAAIFWLCNRHKKRWQSVNKVEFSGPDGGEIPIGEKLNNTERKALKEIAKVWAERERKKAERKP